MWLGAPASPVFRTKVKRLCISVRKSRGRMISVLNERDVNAQLTM